MNTYEISLRNKTTGAGARVLLEATRTLDAGQVAFIVSALRQNAADMISCGGFDTAESKAAAEAHAALSTAMEIAARLPEGVTDKAALLAKLRLARRWQRARREELIDTLGAFIAEGPHRHA